jgi:hypothetical protein
MQHPLTRGRQLLVLVAEHDLSGPLYDLVTAVLAIGEAPR